MGRRDLTDEQWAVLEPLPKGAKPGRPPVWPRRQLIDGIRFRVRTGVPWRDVPPRVRTVGPYLRPVPPMAAGRHLAPSPYPAAVLGRREGRPFLVLPSVGRGLGGRRGDVGLPTTAGPAWRPAEPGCVLRGWSTASPCRRPGGRGCGSPPGTVCNSSASG
ncbi:transposase, partial [Streptomyces sp. NPDC005917]|uniref:transposase n=1 Tax=Streptomyces sp. NPDC005917 TaxID=3155347 RepID=UPI0033FB86F3